MSKQLRLYKERAEEGVYPVGQGLGTQAGDSQAEAQQPLGTSIDGEVGGSSQSPSCSLETFLTMAAEDPGR